MARQGRTSVLALVCALVCGILCAPGCGRDDGKTELELWTLALRPAFNEYMAERIEAFEREHPGVRVRWVDLPFEAVDRKLIATAAAGRAPDVVNMSDRSFARFAAAGAFADLEGLLPGDPTEVYLEGALRIGRIEGRLLALPWYLTTQTLLVNTDLLARGGLTPETLGEDWATLREQAGPFRETTGRFLFSIPLGHESDIAMMMLQEGLPLLRVDAGGRLEPALTDPEAVAFVADWIEAYRRGDLPRQSATDGHAHLIEMFQTGRLAAINTGANFLGRIQTEAPSVFEVTEVKPAVTGSLGRAHIATMVVSVTNASKHPELAAALAWHLTGPESQLALCRKATVLPSTPEVLDDPLFDPPAEAEGAQARIALARSLAAEELRHAVAFTPSLETWPDLRRTLEDQIKRAMLDGVPVAEAMARADDRWRRILRDADEKRQREGSPPASIDAIPNPGPRAGIAGGSQ
ncbi:MAG: extracellular solute-binding protein [Phycisphaerales bacterium]|nr:extracellular solute-binding protein [Phycisphaerales bacterium]